MENRFKMLTKSKPELAKKYYSQAQELVQERFEQYKYMADRGFEPEVPESPEE
jgi:pyruvate-ferredoxin/flavodoxin oxidoreductase